MPQAAFANQDEQKAIRAVARAAHEAAVMDPSCASYLPIAANVPNTASFLAARSYGVTVPQDAQVVTRGTSVPITSFLRAPLPAAQVGDCAASTSYSSWQGKMSNLQSRFGEDSIKPY